MIPLGKYRFQRWYRGLEAPAIGSPLSTHEFKSGLHADVYGIQEGVSGVPVALIVHGGGFVGGTRDMLPVIVVVEHLVKHGFMVASVEYRLAKPWGDVTLADQVEDVRDATQWWREACVGMGGDPARLVLVGLSAGGGLALSVTQSVEFDKFIGIYGAYDIELFPASKMAGRLLTHAGDRDAVLSQSPIHCYAFEQPALLIHGTSDTLTTPAHTERLRDLRDEAGLSTQVEFVEGAQHGFLHGGPSHPASRQALSAIDKFLGL